MGLKLMRMPFIAVNEKHLVTGRDLVLTIYSTPDGKKRLTVSAPQAVASKGKDGEKEEADPDPDHEDESFPASGASLSNGIFSEDGQYLAAFDDSKRLFIWRTSDWQLKHQLALERKCIKVAFTQDGKRVLAGDRSGDVYIFDLETGSSDESTKSGQLLMGHLSLLLDMTLTRDEKFLVTCDRDEKIRVSRFPNSYNIESYCLGHTEFVSSLTLVSVDLLLSGSGDGTLRLWDFKAGKLLTVYNCGQDVTSPVKGKEHPPVKQVVALRGQERVAVSFYKHSALLIYSIDTVSNTISRCKELNVKTEPLSISSCRGLIWVLTSEESNLVQCFDCVTLEVVKDDTLVSCLKLINEDVEFKKRCLESAEDNVLELLYKRWYDNVESYLIKKREREEEKFRKKVKNKRLVLH